MTPPRTTRLGGYGSPLRWATRNGPPRGGRHQLFFASLPCFTRIGVDLCELKDNAAHKNKKAPACADASDAEAEGFEPPVRRRTTVFKTAPLMQGKVVDMFYFPLWTWPDWVPGLGGHVFFEPVFNFADSCVTCGAIYLVLFHWKFFSKD